MYLCEIVTFNADLEAELTTHLGPFPDLISAEEAVRTRFVGYSITVLSGRKVSPRGRPVEWFRLSIDSEKFFEIYCHPEDELEFPENPVEISSQGK